MESLPCEELNETRGLSMVKHDESGIEGESRAGSARAQREVDVLA